MPEITTPPAWAFQVVRDAFAEMATEAGQILRARVYHLEDFTEMPALQAAVRAIELAIERGHVVKAGAAPAAPDRDRDGNFPAYAPGTPVQKITGDYRISGIVRGVILTGAGLWRYAVEHTAEGGGAFIYIYSAANLSTLPTREA